MSMLRTIAVSAAAMGAVLAGAPAMAQAPGQLAGAEGFRDPGRGPGGQGGFGDIMGVGVDAAKNALRNRGYAAARSIRVDGRQYDLWWDGRRCVGFSSYYGRVNDVRDFRDAECGYAGGGGGGGWGNGGQWGGPGGFNTRALEGLRVDSAKGTLRDRGFSYSRAIRVEGRQYDLWWNSRTCVGFASYNGRVTDARSFRDAECGGSGGGPGWGNGGGRFEARELEGLRVDSAKDVLRREGYGYARAIRFDGRQYDLWRSGEHRNGCVGFTSYNGRVTNARAFDEGQCY